MEVVPTVSWYSELVLGLLYTSSVALSSRGAMNISPLLPWLAAFPLLSPPVPPAPVSLRLPLFPPHLASRCGHLPQWAVHLSSASLCVPVGRCSLQPSATAPSTCPAWPPQGPQGTPETPGFAKVHAGHLPQQTLHFLACSCLLLSSSC